MSATTMAIAVAVSTRSRNMIQPNNAATNGASACSNRTIAVLTRSNDRMKSVKAPARTTPATTSGPRAVRTTDIA